MLLVIISYIYGYNLKNNTKFSSFSLKKFLIDEKLIKKEEERDQEKTLVNSKWSEEIKNSLFSL